MFFYLLHSDIISLAIMVYVIAMIWLIRKDVKEIRDDLKKLKLGGKVVADVAREVAHRSVAVPTPHDVVKPVAIREEVKPISSSVPVPSAAHRASAHPQVATSSAYDELSHVVIREARHYPGDPIMNFFAWLRIDWPVKVGALFILIALGYFVSYAIVPSIGPVGRISIGVIMSAVVMVVSLRRFNVSVKQGASLLVLGASGVLLSLFAARTIYKNDGVIDALPALILMIATVSSVMFVAVKKDIEKLGFAALLLAIISPFLTNGDSDYLGLLEYSLMVQLGVVLVVARTHWRSFLATLSAYFTFLLATLASTYGLVGRAHWGVDLSMRSWVELLGYAGIAVFFIASFAGSLRGVVKRYGFDSLSIGLSSVMLLDWIYSFETSDMRPLVLLAWTLMLATASFMVYKKIKDATLFYVSAGVATIFLVIFLAWVLSGPALTLAYTLGLFFVLFIAQKISMSERVLPYVLLGYIGLVIRGIGHSFAYMNKHDAFTSDFIAVIAILLALAAPTLMRSMLAGYEEMKKWMFGLAISWALLIYWPFAFKLLDSVQQGTVFALVSYALVGVALYGRGLVRDDRASYVGGLALLGFVSIHIVLIEASSLDVAMRALVFALVGGLMLSTVFIRKAFKANEK